MKFVLRIILSIFVLIITICLQGCLVAAVGAGIGAVKYGNSKKIEAQSKNMEAYNEYVLGVEKINLEREHEHLSPIPIMSSSEYLSSAK